MKYIEIIADADAVITIQAVADSAHASDFRAGPVADDNMSQMRMLVSDDHLQSVLDALQKVLTAQVGARIIVLPVETSLPKASDHERRMEDSAVSAREALYDTVEKNSRLDRNYMLLVTLSTLVAAIGLIENNIAVVIGAMVIAPLLGPNLALSLGTALGDITLMQTSLVTGVAGVAWAMLLSIAMGAIWPLENYSPELLARTDAGFDSIALALASGAAAALSVSTGMSGVLVGVMVAVALLPPTATLGIMIGQWNMQLAGGAALLLVINVVCVNLASKIVFFFKGMRPRTWAEKQKASHALLVYTTVWLVSLAILAGVIYLRQ
jgi:uncharacterized hydrophobic protein (TIGR00341 family)